MFSDEFNDFFNQIYNSFHRPVKDMYPYKAYRVEDKGFIIVCNTVGIDKDKLSVGIEQEQGRRYPILKIVGATKLEKINFENKVNLGIELKLDREIDSVSYEVKNGLTTVYIKLKEKEIDKITAKEINNDEGFDW